MSVYTVHRTEQEIDLNERRGQWMLFFVTNTTNLRHVQQQSNIGPSAVMYSVGTGAKLCLLDECISVIIKPSTLLYIYVDCKAMICE